MANKTARDILETVLELYAEDHNLMRGFNQRIEADRVNANKLGFEVPASTPSLKI